MHDYSSLNCRRPFPMLHRQFSELVDSVSDQITSYHDNMICTVILQDAHSHNWTEHRPFYEVTQKEDYHNALGHLPIDLVSL